MEQSTPEARGFNRAATLEECMPCTPPENKIRDIRIHELSNGFIVEVGCKSFAFELASTVFTHLKDYINNPNEMERKFNKGELFKK